MSDSVSDQLTKFEAAMDDLRRISEMLNGFTANLCKEGWSEQQARDIVVATYVASAKGGAR